jgi:hypothetical protein
VPALASVALMKELNRLNEKVIAMAMHAISSEQHDVTFFTVNQKNMEKLAVMIGEYIAKLSRIDLPKIIADELPDIILVVQQYIYINDLVCDVVLLQKEINLGEDKNNILNSLTSLKKDTAFILNNSVLNQVEFDFESLQERFKILENNYDTLRLSILKSGAEGELGMVTIDAQLQQASIIKRIAKQILKVVSRHKLLISDLGVESPQFIDSKSTDS